MGFRISFRGVPYFLYVRDPTRIRECERDRERGTQSECESERVRERDRERATGPQAWGKKESHCSDGRPLRGLALKPGERESAREREIERERKKEGRKERKKEYATYYTATRNRRGRIKRAVEGETPSN